jgi:hypothetical protein
VLVSIADLALGFKGGAPVVGVPLPVGGALEDEVCAPEVSRSTAQGASRALFNIDSHSAGSRLEVTIVDALRWRSTTSS